LTAVSLAEIVGVSPQAISLYERGKAKPTAEVLAALSQAVNLPELFFMRPSTEPTRGTVFYRSLSSATKAARARAEQRFLWLRQIAAYASKFVRLPESNFPNLGLPDNPLLLSSVEIEEAAEQVRRYWKMGDGPIGNMVALLENQGAIVARDRLGAATLDGLSEFAPDDRRAYIMIGIDKGSYARWRFDAAHELGHIVLHQTLDQTFLRRSEHFKTVEEQAHRFAAAFLLPMAQFGEDLFAANLDTLRSMKQKWGVSIAMMIVRARHARLISEEAERRLWVNLSRRGWRREEPFDASTPPEEPRLLRQSFELLLGERLQTPEDVAVDLALPAAEIETLAGLSLGYLSGNFTAVNVREWPGRGGKPAEIDDLKTPGRVIHLPPRPRR
jgi:Zn-dependent peptidase ImmA (M78 family)/DNA-binding XRE family transcriptional regulator